MPEAIVQTNEEMENFGFPDPVFYENILNTPKNLEDISQNCGGWTIKEGKLYYDGATDALSSGMAPLDFPFYAGSKYDMRAVAPFRVTPAGKVFCSDMNIAGGAIAGGTIGGVPVANVAIVADTTANAVPTGLTVSATGISTAPDGTQSAYVVLTWAANAESNFDHYLIRYKKHSYTYYTYLTANTNTITIDGLVPNVSYDFGVCTVNKYGISSSFCTNVNSTTGTDNTAPATVTAGSATGAIQYCLIEWTHNAEPDLASYNVYRSETNNSATGVLIANVRTNYFIDGNRVGGTTYYYWIKAVDTSGNVSAAFSTVKSATPRNVTSDDIVTIAGNKVLIDGAVYLSNWRHSSDLTKIDGGDIYANSVTLTQLNFTPVQTTDVIAKINASAEGITIEADNLTINAATTFGAGYNPNTALLTAQEKAQVFTAEPTTPYYVDDLWANGTVLKKCGTQRLTGAYNAADWALATGYTDDTVANSKIKTFIQDTIPTSISAGDFWINTAVSAIGNNMLYRATAAGDTTIAAGHWVAVPDNNKLGGTGSAATGGSYDTAASGARVRIFPDANTGLQIIDDAGNDVFKAIVGGTSVGDIIFGDYAHDQGMFYDKSVGAHGTTYVKGALIGGAGSVFSADYFSGGIINSKQITLGFTDNAGDCFIAAGKTDFDNDESGFIMGIDDSDSNKVKFIIGTPTEYLAVLGDTFINTLRVGGYTPGSVQLIASDAEKSDSDTTVATIMKQIQVGRDGTYRITFDVRSVNGDLGTRLGRYRITKYPYWNLYGYEFEVQQSVAQGADSGWASMPISGNIDVALTAGQSVYLYAYNDGGVTAYVRNLKVKVSALNEVSAPSVVVA